MMHNNLDQKNTTANFSDVNESVEQQLKKIGQELLSAQTDLLTVTTTNETMHDTKSMERILKYHKNLQQLNRRNTTEPN